MADTAADVIRVFDTPANLNTNLKEKMIGYDTTGGRFAAKAPTVGMKYVSEDTLQCLLAGTQTITGVKTFTQNVLMTATKLLTLDQTGGLRLNTASTNSISDDDSLYTVDKLLGIYGGAAEVLDHGVEDSTNALNEGDFTTSTKWTTAGDISISGGKLNFTYSGGTGSATQAAADLAFRIYAGEWYVFQYDVDSYSGDATVELAIDKPGAAAVSIDTAVATSKKVYFKASASHDGLKIQIVSATSGAFVMDNFSLKRLGGTLEAKKLGPGGAVQLSGEGDVESTAKSSAYSGWFGAGDAGKFYRGLQFNSSPGRARLSSSLDIGWGGDLDMSVDQSAQRFAVETIQTGQTVGAVTANLDFPTLSQNGVCTSFLILIRALKDDGTEGYGELLLAPFRRTGGSLVQVGTEVSFGSSDDFGGGISTNISASGDSVRVACTGAAGKTIDWTAIIFGVGNVFADRTA